MRFLRTCWDVILDIGNAEIVEDRRWEHALCKVVDIIRLDGWRWSNETGEFVNVNWNLYKNVELKYFIVKILSKICYKWLSFKHVFIQRYLHQIVSLSKRIFLPTYIHLNLYPNIASYKRIIIQTYLHSNVSLCKDILIQTYLNISLSKLIFIQTYDSSKCISIQACMFIQMYLLPKVSFIQTYLYPNLSLFKLIFIQTYIHPNVSSWDLIVVSRKSIPSSVKPPSPWLKSTIIPCHLAW